MINHLGKNPRNGGSPPKDSKDKKIKIFIKKLELNILKVWVIFNNLKLLKIKTIVKLKKQ